MLIWDVDTDALLRMIAAVIAGGAIGFNRDILGKPTGIRAHALVSLGAAILTIAGNGNYLGANHPDALSRVIQGIVAGIGFTAPVSSCEARRTCGSTIW